VPEDVDELVDVHPVVDGGVLSVSQEPYTDNFILYQKCKRAHTGFAVEW
jgi:hypothetical protein